MVPSQPSCVQGKGSDFLILLIILNSEVSDIENFTEEDSGDWSLHSFTGVIVPLQELTNGPSGSWSLDLW